MGQSSISIGVVGATGVVGLEFLNLLEERMYSIKELRLFAGQKSEGKEILFRGKNIPVKILEKGCFTNLDVVFFSAGNNISQEWAPQAVKEGAFAIDNSSAFRMHKEIPLVVPEVNSHLLPPATQPSLIANPNCSTIQLVVALAPLKKLGIKAVRVASYQSVSGAGRDGVDELWNQTKEVLLKTDQPTANIKTEQIGKIFPHSIAFNNIPQIGSIGQDGFCEEEIKIMKETQKILEMENLAISAFTVRTPTLNCHSEAVWVTLDKNVDHSDFVKCLRPAGGIEIIDDPSSNKYPLNREASGKDLVYVGRIRKDPTDPKTWLLWIVSDNLRKGAALNGLQIAQQIFDLQRGS